MSNSGAVNTSQEQDDNGGNDRLATLIVTLISIIASPLTALTAVIVWGLFSYLRIRRSVIIIFIAPLAILAGVFWQFTVFSFINSWTVTLPSIISGQTPIFLGILTMLGMQAWVAIPLGGLIGLGYASYRWWTRPRWQEYKFRRTPWDIRRTKKVIAEIENDENTPKDGVTLGINEEGYRTVQTDREAVSHTLVIGGAGSGKTTTLMSRARDSIKRGEGMAFVDLKGGDDVPKILAMYAERYGRKFQHWTIQDQSKPYTGPAASGPAYYDPLAQGDHTRRADMVLELREWGANSDYFRNLSQSYLQLLFTVLINNPRNDISTLEDAVDLMSPKYLQERAIPLAANPMFSSVVKSIDALNDEKISNSVRDNLATNRSVLEIFLQSTAGPWLNLDYKTGNNVSLLDAAYKGDIVLFSLDSSAYPRLSANLANLIIQDLKTVSSELRKNPAEKPFQVIVDEFAAIGSDNIVGLINKSRDAKMPTTLATQTLGDLIVANPAVKDQIMGIIASFIIHRANIAADAEIYAGLTGTTIRKKFRQTVEHRQNRWGGIGAGIGAGGGAIEDVEEYRVMPTEIQDLNIGQMVYINTALHRLEHVQCIPEAQALAFAPHAAVVKAIDVSTATHEFSNPLNFGPAPTDMPYQHQQTAQPAVNLEKEPEPAAPIKATPTDYTLLKSFFNNPDELPVTQPQNDFIPPAPVPLPQQNALPTKPPNPFAKKPTPSTGQPISTAKPVPAAPALPVFSRPNLPNPTNEAEKASKPSRSKDEFDF